MAKSEVCSCGEHKGEGVSSPYELAQIYAWYADKMPSYWTKEKWHYLKTYEKTHGWIDKYVFGKDRDSWTAILAKGLKKNSQRRKDRRGLTMTYTVEGFLMMWFCIIVACLICIIAGLQGCETFEDIRKLFGWEE